MSQLQRSFNTFQYNITTDWFQFDRQEELQQQQRQAQEQQQVQIQQQVQQQPQEQPEEPIMDELMLMASPPPGGGAGTGELVSIDNEIPVLLLLLLGYCVWLWKGKKTFK